MRELAEKQGKKQNTVRQHMHNIFHKGFDLKHGYVVRVQEQ